MTPTECNYEYFSFNVYDREDVTYWTTFLFFEILGSKERTTEHPTDQQMEYSYRRFCFSLVHDENSSSVAAVSFSSNESEGAWGTEQIRLWLYWQMMPATSNAALMSETDDQVSCQMTSLASNASNTTRTLRCQTKETWTTAVSEQRYIENVFKNAQQGTILPYRLVDGNVNLVTVWVEQDIPLAYSTNGAKLRLSRVFNLLKPSRFFTYR